MDTICSLRLIRLYIVAKFSIARVCVEDCMTKNSFIRATITVRTAQSVRLSNEKFCFTLKMNDKDEIDK